MVKLLKSKLFSILFMLLLSINLLGQPQLVNKVEGNFNLFYTDNLLSIYGISGNEVVRFNEKGKTLFKTGYLNLGDISSADFTYTLKPIIFHKDYLSVAILDNTLSMQGNPLNLMDIGYSNTSLVCASFDNNFWLYNQDNFEFVRLSFQLNSSSRTGSMQQILGREIEPNYMLERNSNLYVNDPRIGIIVFDIFGTYYKTIGEKNIDSFQVFDEYILFVRNGKLERLNLLTLELVQIEIPNKAFKQIRVEKNRLYLLTESGVEIYNYNVFK